MRALSRIGDAPELERHKKLSCQLSFLDSQHSYTFPSNRYDLRDYVQDSRAAVEAEGVYIGGWSFKNAMISRKDAGIKSMRHTVL